MRHHIFTESKETPRYKVALLTKGTAFKKTDLLVNYVHPLKLQSVDPDDVIAFSLEYDDKGKAPVGFIKEYLGKLLPTLDSLGITHLYVADANYFKVLTKQPRAEPHFGYVLPCKYDAFGHLKVVLGLNHQALIYDPSQQSKLDMSLQTLATELAGAYKALGSDIIHTAQYPESLGDIENFLRNLHQYPELTGDIEGFSLRFWEAGIGTISFAWDEHNGGAFACDYKKVEEHDKVYGDFVPNKEIRRLLLDFLVSYKGKITWHNAAYDVKVIVYTLWMANLLDQQGLLTGLDIMTERWDDTKVIAYLATNSTAGNTLGLKDLAHEFAGNWAKDEIKDIRRIPLQELLQYNLVDALSTWYVKKKYLPIMIQDQQKQLYDELMMPTQKLIIQMELTGMPMSAKRIQEVKLELEQADAQQMAIIEGSQLVKDMNLLVQTKAMLAANAKLKIKQHTIEKFADLKFNPGSPLQMRTLLYENLGLPVIDLTDTKLPAVGQETLEKLINHCKQQDHKDLLQAFINHAQIDKILTTYIPAFERAIAKAEDGIVWLHGSFVLGGTVSGRLSSREPNLQNIPANSVYGKLIKTCFMAPAGWLFCGADFNSLEDYISALTTKDLNKLNVYLKGFDGHCLRAVYYYRDQLMHIDIDDPKSVNSIKKTHPELRQASKTPTFALTYQGTYYTLMANEGWDEETAKRVEKAYHDLYQVSDQYVQTRLDQASKDGYVEVAFGLRVRTPLLKQVVWGSKFVPYEAQAEGRTAGNALGQSYGLLNNRAAVDFWRKVWASPYRLDILPVALIHDAIYALIRDRIDVVEWANRELIKSMQWQELPEIQHDTVKLGAALDIYWPNWANATTLPNNADRQTIVNLCKATKEEVLKVA